MIDLQLGSISLRGSWEGLFRYSIHFDYLKLLFDYILKQYITFSTVELICQILMRTLSPIRSLSPGPKPKIVFNYQPSPLKERPSVSNLNTTPKHYFPISPNIRIHDVQQQRQEKDIEDRCISCPKQATYRAIKDDKNYCSTCAIGVMNKGLDVIRIQLKDQKFYRNFHQKENNFINNDNTTLKIKEFSQVKYQNARLRESELNEILETISHQEQELQNLLDKLTSNELTTQGIKSIYHNKKLGLKRHYQKIKAAIKLSIEKDLQELERRQKSSMKCIQQKKQELKDDIFLLQQIKQDIQPNKNEIIREIEEGDYQKMLKQHRIDTKSILQKKEYSIKMIKELTSTHRNPRESQLVCQTQQQVGESKSQLYDALTYTLIDSQLNKGETLFSFQRIGK